MFKLDDNLLIELGLGSLPPQEKNRMLNHIYETLEMRVGMKLAQRMTNQQLDEFEGFIDRSDEAGALKWLETNFPDYKQVVSAELDTLKSEIKAAAPQIVAASQQQQAAAPGINSYQPQSLPQAAPVSPSVSPQFQEQGSLQSSPFSQQHAAAPGINSYQPQSLQQPPITQPPAQAPFGQSFASPQQQPLQPLSPVGQTDSSNGFSSAPPTPLVPSTDQPQAGALANPQQTLNAAPNQNLGIQTPTQMPPIQ